MACYIGQVNNCKHWGETMKTKVVAFRVTEEQYVALQFAAQQRLMKLAEFVDDALYPVKLQAFEAMKKEQKRLEAKAKRDAKKAAGNGVQ